MAKKKKPPVKNPKKDAPIGDEYIPTKNPPKREDPDKDPAKRKLPPPGKKKKPPMIDPTPKKKNRLR